MVNSSVVGAQGAIVQGCKVLQGVPEHAVLCQRGSGELGKGPLGLLSLLVWPKAQSLRSWTAHHKNNLNVFAICWLLFAI